jgi:phosphoribosylformylglycinamidine cyclo-ligase
VVPVHAIAHVTGGGLPGNVPRVLKPGLDAVFERGSWETPRIFHEIQRAGDVSNEEMARVFNLGLGMVIAVDPTDVEAALRSLSTSGPGARVVGCLVPGSGRVSIREGLSGTAD